MISGVPVRSDASEPARRGRPLDADRTPAILDAVLELLQSAGYDQLRVQDVAERAGVGLGTIYRRWPTKQALVVEAMQSGRGIAEKFVDTGDPHADLVATLQNMATAMTQHADIVGFLASLRREPDVAECFRSTVLANTRARLRALVAAARGCAADDPGLDALADLGPALLLFRVALAGETDDPEALAREVAEIVLSHPVGVAHTS